MQQVKYFDCNCIMGIAKGFPPAVKEVNVENLLHKMNYYGIDNSLISLRVDRVSPFVSNGKLLEAIKNIDRLHPVWVLPLHHSLLIPDPKQWIEEMLKKEVKVVRIEPPMRYGYTVASWACGGLLRQLEKHRIPLLLANSDLSLYEYEGPPGFSPENINQLCTDYPNLPIIILRANAHYTQLTIPLLKRHPNLYIEISYFPVHRGLEFLSQEAGSNKVIFGTGYPYNNPASALTMVNYADISQQEKHLIASGTITHLIERVR